MSRTSPSIEQAAELGLVWSRPLPSLEAACSERGRAAHHKDCVAAGVEEGGLDRGSVAGEARRLVAGQRVHRVHDHSHVAPAAAQRKRSHTATHEYACTTLL
eukprot:1955889-Pleurochrysis_carterae.AAC.1